MKCPHCDVAINESFTTVRIAQEATLPNLAANPCLATYGMRSINDDLNVRKLSLS
jgi:hypothetical protein